MGMYVLGRQDIASLIAGVLDDAASSIFLGSGFDDIDFAIGGLGGSLERPMDRVDHRTYRDGFELDARCA
jgi:hypothetical protein